MLTTIGMLHHQKRPEKIRKAYACAAVAKMEGISFFYFTYHDVSIKDHLIHGKVFEDGKWNEVTVPFPDVVYNAGSPRTKVERKTNNYLKSHIPFTSHSIGNKFSVYKRMITSNAFENILIPTYEVKNDVDVFTFFEEYKTIVLKPKKGSKGQEIIYLEKLEQDSYSWIEKHHLQQLDPAKVKKLINEKIKEKAYLLQPFIQCKTKNGNPFDFRIHVQKDGNGQWMINEIYPRVGQVNGIVSNIHSGGYRANLEPFLRMEFPRTAQIIQRDLEDLAASFPLDFEQLYDHAFDELGIDVGLENEQYLKVFEVNWRPGCKYRELGAAKNIIQYAAYLAYKDNKH